MYTKPVTRRGVLVTLTSIAVGGLTGCGPFGTRGENQPPPHPLAEHLRSTAELALAYEAALVAQPELAAAYGAIRDNHWAHADALATATRQPPPNRTPTGPPPAGGKVALLAAERQAAKNAYEATLTLPGTYTALLGSIAACRATHVEALS